MKKNLILFFAGWSFSNEFLKKYLQKPCLDAGFELLICNPIDHTSLHQGTVHFHCKDIRSLISKEFPEFNIHLLGWSLGGIAAVKFYINKKDNISSLTLINSTPDFISNDSKREESFMKLYSEIGNGNRTILKKFYARLLREQADWSHSVEPSIDDLIEQSSINNNDTLFLGLSMLKEGLTSDELSQITIPTKILACKNDMLIPMLHSYELKNNIPHAEVHILESYSHLLPLQNPQLLLAHLIRPYD